MTPTLSPHWQRNGRAALSAMFARAFAQLTPPEPLTYAQWAERYRILSKEESDDYGGAKFSLDNAPALRGILDKLSERGVRRGVVQKGAQVGYTAGVVCTVLGYHVHHKPCVSLVMFPRLQSAKDFNDEKFAPMVRATRVLSDRIALKSRAAGNSTTRKAFPGGRIKFVASNSAADTKSTTARVIAVEEPDDTNTNVKGQGNSITLVKERTKTVRNSLILIGGTPTGKGTSQIEKEIRTTDQRRFMVPCHHCGEEHAVHPDLIKIPGLELTEDELKAPDIDERFPMREVFGRARWEDAYYPCPHCGGIWTDRERIDNMRRIARTAPHYGWHATREAADPGWFMNELQSVFEGSYHAQIAKKYLEAKFELDRGDATKMIAYRNSTCGDLWEYKGELPEENTLEERAEDYAEWTTPRGGLVAVMFVDVQHDRLAVCVWTLGRGEEMWLAHWGEYYGSTLVPHQGAWLELEEVIKRTVRHPSGVDLRIAVIGVDCSDGQTSDASYSFVRKHWRHDRHVLACKGASDSEGRVEIWTPPKAIDPNRPGTKASKFGLQVHIIGAAKGKDLVLGYSESAGRVRLVGNGDGRMHWYKGVRTDFFTQLLSEMKIPSAKNPWKREWKRRLDRHNEALDCTVGAVYLSRYLRLHLRRPAQWDSLERTLIQQRLLLENATDETAQNTPPAPSKAGEAPQSQALQSPITAQAQAQRSRARRQPPPRSTFF